jgi:long-chain acyl-CoA synthetase
MVGAAPVAPELARRFKQLTGVPVLQGYGMTEASPLTHVNPVYDENLNVVDSAGLLAHDTTHKVVDIETGERELPPGEVGEICIRGPQIMRGYWRAPEATAAALRDGWYYSGDIGYVDERGYLFIRDRKKEMIKFKGFGIAPAEIEALLIEHPAIADAAVIGKPHPEAGEIPKAFVVKKKGAGPHGQRRRRIRQGPARELQDPGRGGVRRRDPEDAVRQDSPPGAEGAGARQGLTGLAQSGRIVYVQHSPSSTTVPS